MSEKITLPVSIVLAGLLIAGGIYLNGRIAKSNPTVAQKQVAISKNIADTIRPVGADDHILGSSDARIIVVEYSDTECPYCRNFHATMNTIMKEYGKDGQVAWVYRHFPIEQLHSKSFKESVATECAGKLGGSSKFWEFINKVYETTPANDGLDPKKLTEIVTSIGLSSASFEACLATTEFDEKIKADMKNATELQGSEGPFTPYSIIIDTKTKTYEEIKGAYPYATIKAAIEAILQS